MRTDSGGLGFQSGYSFTVLALAALLVASVFVAGRMLTRERAGLDEASRTEANIRRVSEALIQFASAQRMLPCPAIGTSDLGVAAVGGSADTCDTNAFVVPWQTLGLRRDDSLDGWGHKISYRVFNGLTGFTTVGAIDLSNCNSHKGATASPVLAAGSRCNPDHRNIESTFVAARTPMLSVNDKGVVKNDNAFVLISHGPTGYGAYAGDGTAQIGLPTAGGAEFANTRSTAPFRIETRSAPNITPTQVAHFDDVVYVKLFSELVAESKLVARDWGDDPAGLNVSSTTFTRAQVAAALGSPSVGNNTGTNSLTVGGVNIRSEYTGSAIGNNISTGTANGEEGIGVISSGSSAAAEVGISSTANESLALVFPARGRHLGISLLDFGTVSGDAERVQFTFVRTTPSTAVVGTVIKSACAVDPAKANFILDVGAGLDFDAIEIRPLTRQSGSGDTTLLVGAIKLCTVEGSICRAPNSIPDHDCP